MRYDFSGWATKNNIRCADGLTIRSGAFKDNDGETVPLVWQHLHDSPDNILGHALLENRDDGVYAYCQFNNTDIAKQAKELVQHGDITSLSIYANKLKKHGNDVLHGVIREVSLVLAGANSGAKIDFPVLAHSGEQVEDECIAYTSFECDGDVYHSIPLELYHAEEAPKEEKKEDTTVAENSKSDKTVGDVIQELTDEQKKAVFYLLNQVASEKESNNDSSKKDDDESEGGSEVKHNVFDNEGEHIQHSVSAEDMAVVFADAKRIGSLRDSVIAHMEEGVLAHAVTDDAGTTVNYGIADIDYLFPEAKNYTDKPDFIKRETEWVSTVMQGVHHTPFTRVKSIYANIEMDEARAKGYIKGNQKKEEVIALLKRSTTPQTIYKKQKLDRDDIIDITDFDVVAWLKGEMRIMLEEEIARAILIGDGRASSSDDKIFDTNIRPIYNDASLYTIQAEVATGSDEYATAKNFIKTAIKSRKNYRGSGTPTLFTTEDLLTNMLLIEDGMGRRIYESESSLATALRVSKIVTVPVMENVYNADKKALMGIIVNLTDYNVGADKGGQTAMFDDFDIDYNQQKYLIETRMSGAMVKPYGAIVLSSADVTSSATAYIGAISSGGITSGNLGKS